jgi:uncharacterized membrane protein YagU involved in acid resistance
MEILQNSWFIGICGGIISSIIVFFITNFIFSKGENKLYNQKVFQGNQEIIILIKPLIVEKNKFTRELYSSLKSAISKKYSIDRNDIYSIDELTSVIIADVLQTPFLNSEQKNNYCNEIIEVKNKISGDLNGELLENKIMKYSLSSKHMSLILGIVTFLFSIVSMFSLIYENDERVFDKIELSFTNMAFLVMIPIIAILITTTLQSIKRLEREKKNINKTTEKYSDIIKK